MSPEQPLLGFAQTSNHVTKCEKDQEANESNCSALFASAFYYANNPQV